MPKYAAFWLAAGVVVTALFVAPLFVPGATERVTSFIERNPASAPLVIVPARFFGVVLAPLPGAPIAFASMAVLPWWQAWGYNLLGSLLGALAAFLLARRFREPVVAYVAPLRAVHEWQERIPHKRQFWGFVGLRFVSLVAFDFVSYAAGLSKLSLRTFVLASLIVDIPITFAFFYLGGLTVAYSFYLFLAFGVLAALGVLGAWLFARHRGVE